MTGMVVYRQPVGAARLSVESRLASWDRAGYPNQVALTDFLTHVDDLTAPLPMRWCIGSGRPTHDHHFVVKAA
jgi:hypothetical protein